MRLGVAAALIEGTLIQGDVGVADGRIAGVGLPGARRGLAVPGLVDLQVNGFAGVDFLAAEVNDYARAGRALLETGVVAYQPTLISAEEAELVRALTVAGRARAEGGRLARILGVHDEGGGRHQQAGLGGPGAGRSSKRRVPTDRRTDRPTERGWNQ
jgi:N-acetylglucosamine-6-phosphate deacetylase